MFPNAAIDYEFCKKVNKPNFEFGTTFILWLISKYAHKRPKNKTKLVKILILSLSEAISEKVPENKPPHKIKS